MDYNQSRQQAFEGQQLYQSFEVTISISDFIDKYSAGDDNGDVVTIGGRINAIRSSGKKLFFIDIISDQHKLQVIVNLNKYIGDKALLGLLRRGDILGVKGYAGFSHSDELSIISSEITLLAPCYHMLGADLKDPEIRYRQRHLDLLINRDKISIFKIRAQVIKQIRKYLDDRNFLEVETPIMSAMVGGASAQPFVSYHRALESLLYLRIAPELALKQLVIAGVERVYEIGKQFRNEGIDPSHHPEFTSCEFYMAYADYKVLFEMTEELLSEIVKSVKGTDQVTFSGKTISFRAPFKRISFIPKLEEILKVSFPADLSTSEAHLFLRELVEKNDLEVSSPITSARILDALSSRYLEPLCKQPTFIVDYPQVMSPLSKPHKLDPDKTERFELFIEGREYINAYSELNDPTLQRTLLSQEENSADLNYCNALEYGLPPTAGWGLGIDRLVMLLTDSQNIKEVILYPAMRQI